MSEGGAEHQSSTEADAPSWTAGYTYRDDIDRLEKALGPYLHDEFFFVNIGASDGVLNDPIYPFVRKYGWQGILVEPVPWVMSKLRDNYRGVEGIRFELAAIGSASETRSFYFTDESAGLGSQMGSFGRDRVLAVIEIMDALPDSFRISPTTQYLPELEPNWLPALRTASDDRPTSTPEQRLRRLDTKCLTFDDLLDRHAVDRVDLVNVDAEGFDLEVFESMCRSTRRPTLACIEISDFSDEQRQSFIELARATGYTELCSFGIFSRVYALSEEQQHPRPSSPA